ncbi:H-NS histone family protein [Cupriavidus basilensis]
MTAAMATTASKKEWADAIRWIRAQMLEYGLTMEELEAAGCFAPPPSPRSVCYRNAEGLSWDGTGEMPDWLRRAVNAGQTVEFFRVG